MMNCRCTTTPWELGPAGISGSAQGERNRRPGSCGAGEAARRRAVCCEYLILGALRAGPGQAGPSTAPRRSRWIGT